MATIEPLKTPAYAGSSYAENTTPAPKPDDRIKIAVAAIQDKADGTAKLKAYYRGIHALNFQSEKFQNQFGGRLRYFRDNLCRIAVQAPADRLEVIGFSSDKESELYKTTWQIWKRSQMPKYARDIHRDGYKVGDAFLIVWTDAQNKARFYRQDPSKCVVFYDEETGRAAWGAKLWSADKYVYITLYFPDRIEKYVSRSAQSAGNIPTTGAGYVKRSVPGETWPLPHPLGVVPLFHFEREDSILTDVIPLNDALNKTIADLLVSSEANSMRQRHISGLSYELDPETGKQIIPFDEFANWFATDNENGKFGQFPEIDIKAFLEASAYFGDEISTVTGIPKYYFRLDGGSLPSGEALRKAESRFTSLIKDGQLDFGETWADAMTAALILDGQAIGAGQAELETTWAPADPMSSNELADLAIKKKQIGVSTEVALSELGYTDDQIKQMAEQNAEAATVAADAFNSAFSAGPPIG